MRQMVYISDRPRLLRRIPLDLFRDRDLVWALIRRDVLLRYRYAAGWFAWTILEPLLYALAFVFLFAVIMDVPALDPTAESARHYGALVLTALVPWLWTARVLERSPVALAEHAHLMRKDGFARETIPVAVVVSSFAAFLVAGAVLFVLLTVFVVWPGPAYAALPLVVLIQLLLLGGTALLLSLAGVHFRDMPALARVLTTLGFFLSPIFYTTGLARSAFEDSPIALYWAKPVFYMNPMTGLIEAYRDIMVHGQLPRAETLVWPALAALAVLGLGLLLFRRQAPTLSDIV